MHAKKFRELEDYVKRMIDKCGLWEQKNCDEEEFSNESEFVIENDFDWYLLTYNLLINSYISIVLSLMVEICWDNMFYIIKRTVRRF